MNNRIYIGIDNGVTGSVGILSPNNKNFFFPVPTKKQQNYTKTKRNITRIDYSKMRTYLLFASHIAIENNYSIFCILERPMINPGRFQNTISAARSLEAVLIVIEELSFPYQYIDSKEWQKELLPKGFKKEELKKASMDIGIRLFPVFEDAIKKQKDADGLLIAEYARRKGF